MEKTKKRSKKPNFSDSENRALLEEVAIEKTIVMSCCQNGATVKKKAETWKQITNKINAVGISNRTVDQVKKRWKDMKLAVLNKAKLSGGTCSGPPLYDVPYEEPILAILGEQTALTMRIDCFGIDTHSLNDSNEEIQWPDGSVKMETSTLNEEATTDTILMQTEQETPVHDNNTGTVTVSLSPHDASTPAASVSKRLKRKIRFDHLQKKKLREKLVDEEEIQLTKKYLRSQIIKNKHISEVQILKKKKLQIEIKLLEQRLK